MATYYLSDATGNDTDNGSTEALAWLTIDKAMNTVAAGDKVWVKADGTYSGNATIDTPGTVGSEIVFEGYTTTTGDGGQATMLGVLLEGALPGDLALYVFKNMIFDADGNNRAVNLGTTTDITWRNCKFTNGTLEGITADKINVFYDCEFHDNSAICTKVKFGGAFINCKFYNNGTIGLDPAGQYTCYNCIFFSNGTYAIDGPDDPDHTSVVINCTFDGDGKDTTKGIYNNAAIAGGSTIAVNNIVYD